MSTLQWEDDDGGKTPVPPHVRARCEEGGGISVWTHHDDAILAIQTAGGHCETHLDDALGVIQIGRFRDTTSKAWDEEACRE